ncbi:Mob1/phocein [Atractiella rhizophila]|nr:Mob1/phocein [Atractiella rhizophila]
MHLRVGTKYQDCYPSTSDAAALNLSQIESPFQLQEYIAYLVRTNPHDVERIIAIPDKAALAGQDVNGVERSPEESEAAQEGIPLVDRDVWLYEQLRRLALDLSHPFVTALQSECQRDRCPEMKAGEWLYLCAAHAAATETECCAIDYITHTLDGATALLNSARYFPSRLTINPTSLKHFTSIARRLYRIFAHAWFHHREVFETCEAETSLYERFNLLIKTYDLISPELMVFDYQGSNSDTSGSPGRE